MNAIALPWYRFASDPSPDALPRPGAGDHDLARRAAAGDLDAFERLFRAHQGRIYGLCLRMTSDRARAEDLTQEAFVRAWRKLDSFRADSSFGSWMHRLAVNVVISDLRLRRLPTTSLDADEAPPAREPAARNEPGGRLDLERAIATLPERARLVFLLHDVEGYKHAEIARLVEIAEGTSKAHLHRARRLLREALER